jgi:hypothetical protein
MTRTSQILELIVSRPDAITSSEISQKLGLKVANITGILTKLWRGQKVKRRKVSRNGAPGAMAYAYVGPESMETGFRSAPVHPKKTQKAKAPVTHDQALADLARQGSNLVAFPVGERVLSLTFSEAREAYYNLVELFVPESS